MKIHVKDIQVSIGTKSILKGVTMEIKDGEIVGVIGPNGSGKSTLLKCMYRVIRDYQGQVLLNDADIQSLSYKDTARQMAVLAQHNIYNFDFSVMDVVMMGRAPYKGLLDKDVAEDYALARRALEQVGMSDMERRSFSSLSGGEQQRVIMARALAQQTECLILDEPTNHLDVKYQYETMELVESLGGTAVIAVHDLNLAARFCHTLVVLQEGQIVAVGTPREVLTPERIEQVYGVKAQVMDIPGLDYPHVLYMGTVK